MTSIISKDYSEFSKYLHIDNETGNLYYQDKLIHDDSLSTPFVRRHYTDHGILAEYTVPYDEPSPRILAIRYRTMITCFQAPGTGSFRVWVKLTFNAYDEHDRILNSIEIGEYRLAFANPSSIYSSDFINLDQVYLFDYPHPAVKGFDIVVDATANDNRFITLFENFHVYTCLES